MARDMRIRWALEEVSEMNEPAYLARHPFGQIPTYEEGDLTLFETGAIVLHIAERHAGLLLYDANARSRAITWIFAALNTVEPPLVDQEVALLLECDKPWYEQRQPLLNDSARKRLDEFSRRLGDAEWLDGPFTAGDLLRVAVLFKSKESGILEEFPNLSAYVARGEARPAFKRAVAARLAVFTGAQPST